jgi:hypothetical protein
VSDTQLDLWGRPADAGAVARSSGGYSPAQKEILRLAGEPDGVTPSVAGRILHAHRNHGRGCRAIAKPPSQAATDWRGTGDACCPWMASDGWDALKRLRARGLVEQRPAERGAPYYAVRGRDESPGSPGAVVAGDDGAATGGGQVPQGADALRTAQSGDGGAGA